MVRNGETDTLKETKKKQIVDRLEDRGAWSSDEVSGESEVEELSDIDEEDQA